MQHTSELNATNKHDTIWQVHFKERLYIAAVVMNQGKNTYKY